MQPQGGSSGVLKAEGMLKGGSRSLGGQQLPRMGDLGKVTSRTLGRIQIPVGQIL